MGPVCNYEYSGRKYGEYLSKNMENTYLNETSFPTRHTNAPSFFIARAKRLLEWNKEKLTSQSSLSIKDIEELFAPKFVVMANGRKYDANYESYYDFLNKFRSNIASIDYNVQEYIAMESTVVMPLTAKVKRTNGNEDLFDAIMLIKFDDAGKIVHWQEVYSIR